MAQRDRGRIDRSRLGQREYKSFWLGFFFGLSIKPISLNSKTASLILQMPHCSSANEEFVRILGQPLVGIRGMVWSEVLGGGGGGRWRNRKKKNESGRRTWGLRYFLLALMRLAI